MIADRPAASPAPTPSADIVVFEQRGPAQGPRVAYARLNAEKSLNALNLAMVEALDAQLDRWAADPAIACVVLHGAGTKGFCAGGDVRALRLEALATPDALPNAGGLRFFSLEYRLDHRIHRYPKPILVWGGGVVMGGGLGLMAGASHRVVTPTSKVAMPEISIGLFPDVGGSWFLSRMPQRWGRYAAMTGAVLNAHDALAAGLADYLLRDEDREALFDALPRLDWSGDAAADRARLAYALQPYCAAARGLLPESNLLKHSATIAEAVEGSFARACAQLLAYDGDDAWLARNAQTLRAGSPSTAALSWEAQQRAESMTLPEVLRMELGMALHCMARPDFAEGVRALLVDKDHRPSWHPETVEAIDAAWLDGYFAPLFETTAHPLADLD